MVCPSSVVAHLTKLLVTVGCMKGLGEPYRLKGHTWPLRVFQILLVHSILGILRFGTTSSLAILVPGAPFSTSAGTYIRNCYDWYSRIVDVLPLALFTTVILNVYGVNEKLRLVVLSLGILPIFFQLNTKRKESQIRKHQLLTNVTTTVQLLLIALVGLRNSNYNVVSLVASHVFERFFVEEFCYRYEIPNTDLTQYSLCFVEIFMLLTLNEL